MFRRSARHWLRLGLGRGEAGGEDRNVRSIWNRSHGIRKLSGKHPLDREKFLSKNKEQRTKRVGLLGQWWRRGSAELEGRLKVPHVENVQRKFKN